MENVNVVVDYAAKAQAAYKEAAGDGKIDLKDALQLIPMLVDLPKVLEAAPKAYDEIKTANHEQRQKLYDKLRATFTIENETIEDFVAKTIDSLIGLVQVLTGIPELRSVVSVSQLPPAE